MTAGSTLDVAIDCAATSRDAAAALAAPPGGRELFGHPRGLVVIAGTELWDRVSFHGMQAMLVLYMVERLLLPGHVEHIVGFARFRSVLESATGALSIQALAAQIFGIYVGLVYLTPVLGGLLGDRLLGRRRAVALGALLMTAGHFFMAFEQPFLLALLLLIFGAGFLRGNLSSQLGDLYAKADRRRTSAFQIYYCMLNTGAFIAPLDKKRCRAMRPAPSTRRAPGWRRPSGAWWRFCASCCRFPRCFGSPSRRSGTPITCGHGTTST